MAEHERSHKSSSEGKCRNIISGIVAFVLAVICTLFTALLAVYFGFFNTNNIVTSFNQVEYYDRVMTHFEEKAWDITIPMGLPKEVVTDVVDIQKVSRDVKGSLSAGMDQGDYTVDTDRLEEALDRNVREYFQGQGMTLDEKQLQVLTEYKDAIATEYLTSVQIPLIQYFGYAKALYHKIMLIGLPICIIIMVCAVTLLLSIRHWKHRGLRYMTYSTLGTALMSAILPGAILLSGIYQKLQLSPDYFYDFIMNYIQGGLGVFLYFALVWLLISGGCLLLIRFCKERLKQHGRRR